jgi:hypothetical protein
MKEGSSFRQWSIGKSIPAFDFGQKPRGIFLPYDLCLDGMDSKLLTALALRAKLILVSSQSIRIDIETA